MWGKGVCALSYLHFLYLARADTTLLRGTLCVQFSIDAQSLCIDVAKWSAED